MQEAVFTRAGVTRIVDYAFGLAATRRGRLTSATKSNGIVHTMPFWDELVRERAAEHPGVDWDQEHIDALCAKLVLDPARFDVIVGSNLFGDILSDLAAAVAGSIGIAPSANLNPEREFPSMFEPVHGSAPDIAGRGIANPLGAVWSGRADARAPRAAGRRRGGARRRSPGSWPTASAHRTSAAPRRPRRSRRRWSAGSDQQRDAPRVADEQAVWRDPRSRRRRRQPVAKGGDSGLVAELDGPVAQADRVLGRAGHAARRARR